MDNIEKKIGPIAWEKFSRHRGETVLISRIVDFMVGDWDDDIINEFCEEILSKNLYSFKYDW